MIEPIYKAVPVYAIHFDDNNVRSDYRTGLFDTDSEDIQSLAESILEVGLIEPLIVTARDDGGYDLVAGERRLRALQLINVREPGRMSDVTVKIYEDISDERKKMIQLIENVQRKDLSDYDKVMAIAEGYQVLSQQIDPETGRKYTQGKYAKLIGMSSTNLSNYLTYPRRPVVIEGLRTGILGLGTAYMCLPFDDSDVETIIAKVKQERINGNPTRTAVAADFRELEQFVSAREATKDLNYAYADLPVNTATDPFNDWVADMDEKEALESANNIPTPPPTAKPEPKTPIIDQVKLASKFGESVFDAEDNSTDSYSPTRTIGESIVKHKFSSAGAALAQGLSIADSPYLGQLKHQATATFDQQNFLIRAAKARLILSKFYANVDQLDNFQVFDRLEQFLRD